MNINKVLNSIKKNNILKLLFVVFLMCLLFYIINYNNLTEKDPVEMFTEKMDEGTILNTSGYNELQGNKKKLEREIQDFKEERNLYEEHVEQRRKSEYEKDKEKMEEEAEEAEEKRLAKLNETERLKQLLQKEKDKSNEMVEQKKLEEQKRLVEQKRLDEQKKLAEQKRLEQQKIEEEQKRLAEEQRLKQVEIDRVIQTPVDGSNESLIAKGYTPTRNKYPIKDTSLPCIKPTGNTQEEINNECIDACKTNDECRRVWIYDKKSQKRCCLKGGELGKLDESDKSTNFRKNQPGIYWDLNKKVKFVEPNCNVGRPDETECNKRYSIYEGKNTECTWSWSPSRSSCDFWDIHKGKETMKRCDDTNNCLILK